MGGNNEINNLTTAYNGSYWQGANTSSMDFVGNLVYTGNLDCVKSNWDYGITLNEDAIKDIVEKLTKQKETAKITPDKGPEIPKWIGFLDI